jgi:predicted RNA-binding protein with PUA-like domain
MSPLKKGKRSGSSTGTTKKTAPKKAAPKRAKQAAAKAPAAKAPARKPGEGAWASVFTPRAPGERRYWLVKSEPDTFSFDDLVRSPGSTTFWNGVRNFAARNFMRDGMKVGDGVFFYHSSTKPQAIVGVCEVVTEAYPDSTAFDKSSTGYDPDSDADAPTWYMVDLRAVAPLARPVTLPELKSRPELADMALLRIGRLSVTPVTAKEWKVIQEMGR